MENIPKTFGGRKRKRDESTWEQNVQKACKNKGEEYISKSKNPEKVHVPRKIFTPLQSCCKKKCFETISLTEQEKSHSTFWKLGDYHKQSIFLSMLMKCNDPKKVNARKIPRLVTWSYLFSTVENVIVVCKKFVMGLFNLSQDRLRVVQRKIINNESFDDGRGRHKNRVTKLTDEMKQIIQEHCLSMPFQKSHYSRESTELNYFTNPELTITKLFIEFCDYYVSVTQDLDMKNLIDESTYAKYFNRNLNFAFSLPRTDVCNRCYESDLVNVQSSEIMLHKQEVKEYKILRERLMSQEGVLCCEFDYAQNLALPKIPVNEQFYKRLLWLYLFNVHVYDSEQSYMYPFLEGSAKKGANTVCSFLNHAVEQEFDKIHHKKIVLFSDAAGGQNRNYTVFAYLLTLSIKLEVDICHVFPVRGHSYCQCDRNFGLYSHKKKKLERIETAEEYIKLIRNSRDPPFTIVQSAHNHILHDYEKSFKTTVPHPKSMKISQAYVIHYLPSGNVPIFDNYNETNPSKFKIEPKVKLAEIERYPPAVIGITDAKMKDVKSLLKYLTPKGKAFFNEYFESITNSKSKDDSVLSSDED